MDCLFCQIVVGQLSSYRVYEDKNYLAFLSIAPLNPGHTLIIPKKHFRWVWDMPVDRRKSPNLGQYYQVVGKIAKAIRKALRTDFLVSVVIGEDIPHAHIWLIPRFKNDGHGGGVVFENVKKISEQKMKQITNKIKKNIK